MTRAGRPPTVTVGVGSTAGAPLTVVPAATGGLVVPNPVSHRMMVSPGLAATAPGSTEGSPSNAKSGTREAMAEFVAPYVKNAGATVCKPARAGALSAPLLLTMTSTMPTVLSDG